MCFQCQQVCEKAIKALRYGRGERAVLGHALIELAAPLEAMARFRESLAVLDQYYVPTRCPNGLPGGIPSDVYTGSQATKAVEVAREVVAAVGVELGPETDDREVGAPSDGDAEGSPDRSEQGDAEA